MAHKLTRDDVRAMRKAEGFVVRVEGEKATLEVFRKRRVKDGFGGDEEERRDIPISLHWRGTACFVEIFKGGAFAALALLAKAGDTIGGRVFENSNGYLKAACVVPGAMKGDSGHHEHGYTRLFYDVLWLDLNRERIDGSTRAIVREVEVSSSICPDNSARPVRS